MSIEGPGLAGTNASIGREGKAPVVFTEYGVSGTVTAEMVVGQTIMLRDPTEPGSVALAGPPTRFSVIPRDDGAFTVDTHSEAPVDLHSAHFRIYSNQGREHG